MALTFQRTAGTHEVFLVLCRSIFPRKPAKHRHLDIPLCTKPVIAPLSNMLHEKIKTCGPASNVAYLEQTRLCAQKHGLQISCEYRPMFCMVDKFRLCATNKLFTVILSQCAHGTAKHTISLITISACTVSTVWTRALSCSNARRAVQAM